MCSSSISFFTLIFQCQCLLTCHTQQPILFHGVSGSSFMLWTLHFQVCFFCPYFLMFHMTSWFTYFINLIVYFISISEYFATIILPELRLLFLNQFFQPIFHCKCLITCHTHRLTLFNDWFLKLWFTEVHLYHLCPIFS